MAFEIGIAKDNIQVVNCITILVKPHKNQTHVTSSHSLEHSCLGYQNVAGPLLFPKIPESFSKKQCYGIVTTRTQFT